MTTPAIGLTITTGGLLRFTQAQEGQPVDLTISTVGFGSVPFVLAPTLTSVPGEIKRIASIAGIVQDDSIVHLTVRDDSSDTYIVYGVGLYLADGTLFAVYGQATPILQKSVLSSVFLALDLKFPAVDVTSIVFGDTSFIDPPAAEDTKGVAKISTQALVDAGTDDLTIVTPKKLAARLAAAIGSFVYGSRKIQTSGLASGGGDLTADRTIGVLAASSADAVAGSAADRAMTPAADLAALDARLGAGSPTAFAKSMLAAVSATATRALIGLGNVATLNVGAGGGIDADKLDGQEGAYYLAVVASGSNAQGSWRKFSDGWIEQWGTQAIAGNGNTVIMLPIPFPTQNVWSAVAGGNSNNDAQDNYPIASVPFALDRINVHNACDDAVNTPFYAKGF